MDSRKRSLGSSFGGIREATCKGNRPLETYAKRIGCVCVCVYLYMCVCVCGKLSIKAWR